ncbi:hypothetical protein J7L97_05895 [Candidatus Bathyarchaeota archaeon]|nr:hypothetical protein [Candidatus Bathyarchaeota archaeon]
MEPLTLDEERIINRAAELYLAKKIAEYAGELTGAQVVAAHKCVVEKICAGKTGWEALECIIDGMEKIYREIEESGFETALRKYTCAVP